MWSLGVLLYQLVSGYLPFVALSESELYRKIKNCEYEFISEFDRVSPECKDLISQLLQRDPNMRITGQQALAHPWFTVMMQKTDDEFNVDEAVIKRLIEFKGQSALKRAAMNMLVQLIPQEEVKGLREQFEAIDEDGSGLIDVEELGVILKKKNISFKDGGLEKIIEEMDYYGTKQINYSEFLSATINLGEFLTTYKL